MTALALMGLLPEGAQTSGSVRFDGQELVGLPDEAMGRLRGHRIAMIFQEPMTALNPLHTVGAQVAEPLRQHLGMERREARAEALRLLEQVRLPQAKGPSVIGGGPRAVALRYRGCREGRARGGGGCAPVPAPAPDAGFRFGRPARAA